MTVTTAHAFSRLDDAEIVVPAPGDGPGNWSGAASATLVDGVVYLTYRVRRPLVAGRGVSTVVSRSSDGVRFERVCEVFRDEFGAESFERPVVLRRPDGGWRLYLSCATPGTKHWWIEALDADRPEDLPTGTRTVVLPGDDALAVKDPVVVLDERPDAADPWLMWVCEHPLTEPGHEDRMTTALYTSADGLAWQRRHTVLAPRPGTWDARGTRVATVLSLDPVVALYDGRPTAIDNWHETTGIARGDLDGVLTADDDEPTRSPHSDGALRYATHVRLADGSIRWYVEVARPDGAHDLVTLLGPGA